MNLFKKSLAADPNNLAFGLGHLLLRVAMGLMIFCIHGLHKLEGGIGYVRSGKPWPLGGRERHAPSRTGRFGMGDDGGSVHLPAVHRGGSFHPD